MLWTGQLAVLKPFSYFFLASPQQGLEDFLFFLQPLEDRSISEFEDGYILYIISTCTYICPSLRIPVL